MSHFEITYGSKSGSRCGEEGSNGKLHDYCCIGVEYGTRTKEWGGSGSGSSGILVASAGREEGGRSRTWRFARNVTGRCRNADSQTKTR